MLGSSWVAAQMADLPNGQGIVSRLNMKFYFFRLGIVFLSQELGNGS
jgi:hypothetical protein